MLQFHLALGLNPLPIDRIQTALDRAIDQAPQDDRVWLGRAYLALRDGRLAEAQSWLDACRRRRPDDPVVWRCPARMGRGRRPRRTRPARRCRTCRRRRSPGARPRAAGLVRRPTRRRRGGAAGPRAGRRGSIRATSRRWNAWPSWRRGRAGPRTPAELRRRKAELDGTLHRYRTAVPRGRPGRQHRPGWPGWPSRSADGSRRRGSGPSGASESPDDPDARAAVDRLARRAEPDRRPSSRSLADVLDRDSSMAAGSRPARPFAGARPPAPLSARVPRRRRGRRAWISPSTMAARPAQQLPETSGGGVALLDYDGDGRLDVYRRPGRPVPARPRPGPASATASSATRATGPSRTSPTLAGLAAFPGGYGHGVAVGDYDNDGHPDLFVTRWRSYALYHNRGDGTFEDATARRGPGRRPRLADVIGLRRPRRRRRPRPLRLPLPRLGRRATPRSAASPSSGRVTRLRPAAAFAARPDHLFRNDGGRFVDVTTEAGIVDRDGRGLGVVAADLDDDGKVDLFVANDGTANFLFLNRGGLRFEEAGHESGWRRPARGGYQAGMGIARGRPRRRRPARPGRHQLLRRVDHVLPEPRRRASSPTARPRSAWPRRAVTAWASASPSWTPTTTAGSTCLTANGHIDDERPEIPYADAGAAPARAVRTAG